MPFCPSKLSFVLLLVAFGALAVPASADFPLDVVDDRGREITIERAPQRIVAVGALYAQIVVDLGVVDRLVAVAASDDNPAEVATLPTVGPSFAPSIEVIVGTQPDLVLGATDWGGERPALENAGITVLTTPWLTSIGSIFATVRTIGAALGVEDAAEATIGRIATEIVEIEAAVLGRPPVSAAFLYASSPDDPPYAAGGDAIEHELIARAGGINVFSDLQFSPQVGFEQVVARDPQVIFTAPSQVNHVTGQPLFQGVSAVAEGRVVGIRASDAASTRVAAALRSMVVALHGIEP